MTTKVKDIRDAYSIRVPSPDGTVFVKCIENDEGRLEEVVIFIGKAGTPIASWADGLSKMITLALKSKDLPAILQDLSMNSSYGRYTETSNKIQIRSGIDAVFNALFLYKRMKTKPQNILYDPKLVIPTDW